MNPYLTEFAELSEQCHNEDYVNNHMESCDVETIL